MTSPSPDGEWTPKKPACKQVRQDLPWADHGGGKYDSFAVGLGQKHGKSLITHIRMVEMKGMPPATVGHRRTVLVIS